MAGNNIGRLSLITWNFFLFVVIPWSFCTNQGRWSETKGPWCMSEINWSTYLAPSHIFQKYQHVSTHIGWRQTCINSYWSTPALLISSMVSQSIERLSVFDDFYYLAAWFPYTWLQWKEYSYAFIEIILLSKLWCMALSDDVWGPKPSNTSNIHYCGFAMTMGSAWRIPWQICGVEFPRVSSVMNTFSVMMIVLPTAAPFFISHFSIYCLLHVLPSINNTAGTVTPLIEPVWYIVMYTSESLSFLSLFIIPRLPMDLAFPFPHACNHVSSLP